MKTSEVKSVILAFYNFLYRLKSDSINLGVGIEYTKNIITFRKDDEKIQIQYSKYSNHWGEYVKDDNGKMQCVISGKSALEHQRLKERYLYPLFYNDIEAVIRFDKETNRIYQKLSDREKEVIKDFLKLKTKLSCPKDPGGIYEIIFFIQEKEILKDFFTQFSLSEANYVKNGDTGYYLPDPNRKGYNLISVETLKYMDKFLENLLVELLK